MPTNDFDTGFDSVFETDQPQQPVQPTIGLKWHKFLIYFGLWLGALSYVGMGLGVIAGLHYSGMVDRVALVFPGIRTVDMLYGIGLIVLGAVQIVGRFRLAKFQWSGVEMQKVIVVVGAVLNLAYPVVASMATSMGLGELLDSQTVIQNLASAGISLYVLNIYYNKRKFLFK